ncbi:MAG TPA: hypothetical protein VF062_03220 [Candidatus Limnocylindrales bacterium]
MDGKSLPPLLIGLAAGVTAGDYLGPNGLWYGIALAVVGIGLWIAGPRRPKFGEEFGMAPTAVPPESERPTLASLGPRVEQILRLAEEQAAQMVSEARAEADAIRNAARES